jgi:hypothetical protein
MKSVALVTEITSNGARLVATEKRPTPLDRMLAAADVTAPPAGTKLNIEALNAKLSGKSIARRLEIKCALRSAGMLD